MSFFSIQSQHTDTRSPTRRTDPFHFRSRHAEKDRGHFQHFKISDFRQCRLCRQQEPCAMIARKWWVNSKHAVVTTDRVLDLDLCYPILPWNLWPHGDKWWQMMSFWGIIGYACWEYCLRLTRMNEKNNKKKVIWTKNTPALLLFWLIWPENNEFLPS